MGTDARIITVCALVVLLGAGFGCGRKLPPLPPGPGDPVEISSIEFQGDGTVEARVNVSLEGAKVTLLGKPKGLCPICTEDLRKRDEKLLPKAGAITLEDPAPESDYMVYRIAFEKGTTSFLTTPRVVRK